MMITIHGSNQTPTTCMQHSCDTTCHSFQPWNEALSCAAGRLIGLQAAAAAGRQVSSTLPPPPSSAPPTAHPPLLDSPLGHPFGCIMNTDHPPRPPRPLHHRVVPVSSLPFSAPQPGKKIMQIVPRKKTFGQVSFLKKERERGGMLVKAEETSSEVPPRHGAGFFPGVPDQSSGHVEGCNLISE